MRAILSQTFSEKLEFPFLPDEAEHLIISLTESRSILLVGRSGTGKTTIIVQRLWLHWRLHYEKMLTLKYKCSPELEAPPLHQLFVTANPILRNSVSKSFKALQSGYVLRDAGAQGEEASEEDALPSLVGLDKKEWPLFLRAHNWLRLLDATLETPFFSAAERSAAASKTSGWHSEAGVMESLLLDDDDLDDEADEGGVEEERDNAEGEQAATMRDEGARRTEMTFELFETILWPHMLTHKASAAHKTTQQQLSAQAKTAEMRRAVERSSLKASMVFREICSYIKGSSESLDCPNGHLSKEQYCKQLGRKVAPSFDKASCASSEGTSATPGRADVYDLFLQYEEWKGVFGAYDVMDAGEHLPPQLQP